MFPFRPEVIAARVDRLPGEVAIFIPVRWQLVGGLLFVTVVAAMAFVALAGYARVEIVPGQIAPDKGVAAVVPPRPGIITRIDVAEGEEIAAGAPLALVQLEEFLPEGGSTGAAMEEALADQQASLVAEARSAEDAARSRQRQNDAQQAGLAAEVSHLEAQLAVQERLVVSAEADLRRLREVASRGFISDRDVRQREDALLMRRQQLAQLRQSLAGRSSALAESQREEARLAAEAAGSAARLSAGRAQLAQQAATVRGGRAYVLRAPVAGRVTALTARVGEAATVQRPLMSIVPASATLRAELAAPPSAIGFIRPGQEVRLAIDGYPYQRFGTVPGRVMTVSSSAVERAGGDGRAMRVYPIIVMLDPNRSEDLRARHALLPGMTVSARVVTEKRSFLEWLFEPVLAVGSR